MLGKIVTITLLAFSSAALAQQQCQLECTRVTQNGQTRVTRSCYALDAEQCALVAKADTGGQQTCRGYLTTKCVNDLNASMIAKRLPRRIVTNIAKLPELLGSKGLDL